MSKKHAPGAKKEEVFKYLENYSFSNLPTFMEYLQSKVNDAGVNMQVADEPLVKYILPKIQFSLREFNGELNNMNRWWFDHLISELGFVIWNQTYKQNYQRLKDEGLTNKAEHQATSIADKLMENFLKELI